MALNAARSVPLVHGIQPSAQAAVWYKHVHEMWKVSLDSLRALSAFVAGHWKPLRSVKLVSYTLFKDKFFSFGIYRFDAFDGGRIEQLLRISTFFPPWKATTFVHDLRTRKI